MFTKTNRAISFILTILMMIGIIPVMSIGVSAALPDDKLIVHYTFDEIVNGYLLDSSGKGNHAETKDIEAVNDATKGKVAKFNGTSSFAKLPDGFMSEVGDFTISAWYYYNDPELKQWCRLWDFGNGTLKYFCFSPNSATAGQTNAFWTFMNDNYHYGKWWDDPRTPGDDDSVWAFMDGFTGDCISEKWVHVAITMNGDYWGMYINGELYLENNACMQPKDLGWTTANFLGKSQFATDPNYMGMMDEFRFYTVGFTAAQIKELYTVTGPATPDSVKNAAPAAYPSKYTATINNTVDSIVGRWALDKVVDGYVIDDVNGNNGQVYGATAGNLIVNDSARGNVLNFNGENVWVYLPDDLLSGLDEVSLSLWYYNDTVNDPREAGPRGWSRILDFGRRDMIIIAPRAQFDSVYGEVKFNDSYTDGVNNLNANDAYDDKWTHIVLTYKSGEAKFYVNGVLQDTKTAVENSLREFVAVDNYLGRSKYNDYLFLGKMSELVIYNKVLSEAEVNAAMKQDFSYLAANNVSKVAEEDKPDANETPAEVVIQPTTQATQTAPTTGDVSAIILLSVLLLCSASVIVVRRIRPRI